MFFLNVTFLEIKDFVFQCVQIRAFELDLVDQFFCSCESNIAHRKPFCRSRSHLEEADDTGTPPAVIEVGFVCKSFVRNSLK